MTKRCIYTAIFGGYDAIQTPEVENSCDYILFTDDKNCNAPAPWKVVTCNLHSELSHVQKNRYVKFFPWKFLDGYDESLYIDGNLLAKKASVELFSVFKGSDFGAFHHPFRSSIIEEVAALRWMERINKASFDDAINQIKYYFENGYQEQYLVEANVIYRKHSSKEVQVAMEAWWKEFNRGVKRDQLSLGYSLKAVQKEYIRILPPINVRAENPYFNCLKHPIQGGGDVFKRGKRKAMMMLFPFKYWENKVRKEFK
ncbi:glycosyltransferase domain-containing protein [Pseudoalteromonas sp. S4741]|uniref:glycosyltransferase domain-containing protein n=1 Tax=Pseudoalteromonas sp. S4741 TaxID=579563 RepID=UPI0014872E7D|nr:glycosyltransferase domain-containing protein [Pseudoalteromonas sp. S4741]